MQAAAHLPLMLLLSLLLLVATGGAAAAAAAAATATKSPMPPASDDEAADATDEVKKELVTLMKIEKEEETVELCGDSLPAQASSGGSKAKTAKKPKIKLVNVTESFVIEHYCCSSGGGGSATTAVRCSFRYKPAYYFLCTVSVIALSLMALLALVAVVHRCRRPWNLFGDLLARPLINRSSLSVRSDPVTPARVVDTSVDSAAPDCQQQPSSKRHQASVRQSHDDSLLPDIF